MDLKKQISSMKKTKKIIRSITPPLIVELYKHFFSSGTKNRLIIPEWHEVQEGIIKGKKIYVNNYYCIFKEMIQGDYDSFFFQYLESKDLNNGIICDVGGHIGFHTLAFAELVGTKGKVITFEPNPYNYNRIKMILSRNPKSAKQIQLSQIALSNENGETEFNFSANIEDQSSSGGYIKNAYTPLGSSVYETSGFKKCIVRTSKLDDFLSNYNFNRLDLIKIDVEGAEHFVLYGAEKTIKKHRPLLLIEIYSVIFMLKVTEILYYLGYSINLLKQDSLSRCFIAAEYHKKNKSEIINSRQFTTKKAGFVINKIK